MDKLFSKSLEKTVNKEVQQQFQLLKETEQEKHIPQSEDEEWCFEDRLLEIEEKLRERVFGLDHDIESRKALKREKTNENLVTTLCDFEKYTNGIIYEQLNPIELLKKIIDRNAPFLVCDDMYILRVERDRSELSLPQKNEIAIQVAAQLIWYIKKDEFPTIGAMAKCLLSEDACFYSLLEMKRFQSPRTVENWIRPVFPVENHLRKGRPLDDGREKTLFDHVRLIENVFSENNKKVNFMKLRFIIFCLSRMLKIFGLSINQIKTFDLTRAYILPLPIHLHMYVYIWINEAVEEKIGRIFDV